MDINKVHILSGIIVFLLIVIAYLLNGKTEKDVDVNLEEQNDTKIFPYYKYTAYKFYEKCIDFFRIKNYEFSREIPERLSIYYFLDEKDKVLEIGGNVGGVSEVIASKLNNPKNLVVVEPSDVAVKILNQVSIKSGGFNIHHGVLTYDDKNFHCSMIDNNSSYFDCKEVKYKVNNNITFEELQNKFNIKFNTLVIDCEGCYEELIKYAFSCGMFKNILKIFIEWDGEFMENLFLENGFVLLSVLPHENLVKGNRVYIRNIS